MMLLLATGPENSSGQVATEEQVVVEADRLPNPDSNGPFDVHVLEAQELEQAPELRLDDILRNDVAGFSLFRRNSSRTANPTTQGVTLRNFGPSGAGRTLVLLDGIPLNDPFAGYVLWSQIPADAIGSVVVVSGGGAGLFGNQALAGTIFLVSRPTTETTAYVNAAIGSYDTYDVSGGGSVAGSPFTASVYAEHFSTSGYPVLRSDQRGPVDNSASSDSSIADVRGEWQMSADTSLRLEVRQFFDDRGNGTIFTRNDTVGTDASATLSVRFPTQSAELQLSVYGQHRKFRGTFSSINPERTVETPALDQFDVPANAIGASAVWSMAAGPDHRLTLGSDFRFVEGETNEAFLWNGSRFTRLRHAGGDQDFVGLFAEDVWTVSKSLKIVGGLRFDYWDLFDGFRNESNSVTGAVTMNSRFPDRSGDELNGRLSLSFEAAKNFTVRGAVYSGFRVPTLNELYRPFRVGNDVTEANPALDPEQLIGGEAGLDWQPIEALRLSATGFINRLEDAIGNVTIGVGPGTFNPGGFIPAGGVLRQRQNLNLVIAPGIETGVRWRVLPSVVVRASYLFTHPEVTEATDPTLEGKLLAQTPENVATAAIEWTPTPKWFTTLQLRYNDRQFEDDQNSRVLAPFVTLNAAVMYEFSTRLSMGVKIENLLNEKIETGKSADGLVSIGNPRLVTVQVKLRF
jgi:outer membrane receptor protein involved in Fe transport